METIDITVVFLIASAGDFLMPPRKYVTICRVPFGSGELLMESLEDPSRGAYVAQRLKPFPPAEDEEDPGAKEAARLQDQRWQKGELPPETRFLYQAGEERRPLSRLEEVLPLAKELALDFALEVARAPSAWCGLILTFRSLPGEMTMASMRPWLLEHLQTLGFNTEGLAAAVEGGRLVWYGLRRKEQRYRIWKATCDLQTFQLAMEYTGQSQPQPRGSVGYKENPAK